jgi:3-deoxy-D-manno-octulosonic acid kinase
MGEAVRPPEGFEILTIGPATLWVRPEALGWTESVLSTAPTLYAAGVRLGRGEMAGRGPVYEVPTPLGAWAIRHFMRGGSVASLLGDRYLAVGTPRPFAETHTSQAVRLRGIDTPRVVAAAVYRSGLWYRGDLVTELVPDAEELVDVLFDDSRRGLAGAVDRKEALREAGALIHRMGRAGVHHPDLNDKNVLLRWSGGAPVGYVLDLDRASAGSGHVAVGAMTRRLLRSLRKFERRTGMAIPPAEKSLLVNAAHGELHP